jgi:hypothetical protein
MRGSGYRVGKVSTSKHTVTSPAVCKAATCTKDFWGKKPPNTAHFKGEKKVEITLCRL